MFWWWHRGGSPKNRPSNTNSCYTPAPLPSPVHPMVASRIPLSCPDAGMEQRHGDEESRLDPSHPVLGSQQHLAPHVQLSPGNQHIICVHLILNIPILYSGTFFLLSWSCLSLKLLHLLIWNAVFRIHIHTLGSSDTLEIRNQLLRIDVFEEPHGNGLWISAAKESIPLRFHSKLYKYLIF